VRFEVAGRAAFAATGGVPFAADRPGVVLLHGAGMDRTVWALQTRYFAHHGRSVLALDLPGHGGSAGPPSDDVDGMAAWLIAALEALGARDVALVGHSMGALVALAAAARLGRGLRALVLLGAAPRMPVHPDLLAAAKANDHLAIELVTAWGHGPRGQLGGNRAPGLWLMGGAGRVLERAAPGVLYNDLMACDAYAGALTAAAAVACPCRVIVGAEDRMTPARAGRKLAAAIPGAEAVEIAGAGHMMMLECPDRTLDAMKAVL